MIGAFDAQCRADIALAVADLKKRGAVFTSKPHLIARMELMQEAPKGYTSPA